MNNHGFLSVQMAHNMLGRLLRKVEPIVRQILRIVKKEVQSQAIISLERPHRMTLFVLTILNLRSVKVEMLKRFIHFSTYMMRRF